MQAPLADPLAAARPAQTFDASLDAVEGRLAALGMALRERDAAAIEAHAADLQRALAATVQRFGQSVRRPGAVAPALQRRLALASSQAAAQRESVARAAAALERAIGLLMPAAAPAAVYGEAGLPARAATNGSIQA